MIADPMCHVDASYEEESYSCIPQSQSNELSAKSGYSSESDEINYVGMSSYESNATWEEESNGESEYSFVNEGMIFSTKYENVSACQYFLYIGQFDGRNLESDFSSKCEDK